MQCVAWSSLRWGIEEKALKITTDNTPDNFKGVKFLRRRMYTVHQLDIHQIGTNFRFQCAVRTLYEALKEFMCVVELCMK